MKIFPHYANGFSFVCFLIVSLLSGLSFGSCSSPPVLAPESTEASAIRAKIQFIPVLESLSITYVHADTVYFIRHEGKVTGSNEIFASNYVRENRAYLLNAPPGRYTAVAALIFPWPASPPDYEPGKLIRPDEDTHVIFFQEEVASVTTTVLKPGEIVCQPVLDVKMLRELSEADALQKHVEGIVAPGRFAAGFQMRGGSAFLGSLRKETAVPVDYCNKIAMADLAGSAWVP